MAVVQKHDLSTLDKVRGILGWTLFVLLAPLWLLVALFIFLQIFMLAAHLLGSWVSNHF